MNTKIRRLLGLIALPVAVALLTPTEAPAPGDQTGRLLHHRAHWPSPAVFISIGGAFSTLIGKLGYRASATATGATAENINALLTGQGEMAIAMSDAVIQAIEAFLAPIRAKSRRPICGR